MNYKSIETPFPYVKRELPNKFDNPTPSIAVKQSVLVEGKTYKGATPEASE